MRAARLIVVLLAVVAIGAVAAGCSDDGDDQPASAAGPAADADPTGVTCVAGDGSGGGDDVAITGFTFDPDALSIEAGTSVTFTNHDPTDHSVWSADRVDGDPAFESVGADPTARLPELLHEGDSTTCTFPAAGTYAYLCGVHNSMTGTITVT